MRLAIAIALLLPLNACASYPELARGYAPVPVQPQALTDVDAALAEAARLQGTYSTGYTKSAQAADWSQLPIIGAAAAAAWVLLVDHKSAAKTAGKIGIGVGAYSAARGQLFGAGLTDSYLAGHAALTCVLAEGSNFSGVTAKASYDAMDVKLGDVATALGDLTKTVHETPASVGKQADALQAAQVTADAAIEQARAASRTALAEEGAYLNAGPVFRNAVASISVRVASKARVRPPIDFATLRDSLALPKPASTATGHSKTIRRPVDAVLADIRSRTTELLRQTMALIAVTRPYRQSLEHVAACPDQVR